LLRQRVPAHSPTAQDRVFAGVAAIVSIGLGVLAGFEVRPGWLGWVLAFIVTYGCLLVSARLSRKLATRRHGPREPDRDMFLSVATFAALVGGVLVELVGVMVVDHPVVVFGGIALIWFGLWQLFREQKAARAQTHSTTPPA
jgi:hypothetical protein